MLRLALLALAAFIVLLGLIWVGQRRLIYFPHAIVPPPHAVALPEAEPVTFSADDGAVLQGWFVPVGHATLTAIVFNGNAGNRAYRAELARALNSLGVSVLLFDYRGFGGSTGTPTESGLELDALAARAWATGRGIDPARLIYFGESLGSAVAVALAARHPPGALILRSPFTSMADVGARHYPVLPVRLLLQDRYDALARIGSITVPLLVIAGSRDAIVPLDQSRRLYDAAPGPKLLVVVDNADHNDAALLAGPEMMRAIRDFLSASLPPSTR